MKPKAEWVIMNSKTGEMECGRCGEHKKIPMPIDMSKMITLLEGFTKMHSICEIKETEDE